MVHVRQRTGARTGRYCEATDEGLNVGTIHEPVAIQVARRLAPIENAVAVTVARSAAKFPGVAERSRDSAEDSEPAPTVIECAGVDVPGRRPRCDNLKPRTAVPLPGV